jgi:uncharacterized peroxidase-related enzyme
MDQRANRRPRLTPLPEDHTPELAERFAKAKAANGFVPNSQLVMQRRPKIVAAFAGLSAAIWAPDNLVDRGFKRLVAHVASRAAGCQYCMAHAASGALKLGIEEQRLEAIWEYERSPLFSEAERAALDVAVAAAQVPNGVTDEMFARLREHWSDDEIVEIVAVIALFGFLNRWNDTMATPLEDEAAEIGEKFLASHGWNAGKHAV